MSLLHEPGLILAAALLPLVLGARDPVGDLVACRGGGAVAGRAPVDIVAAGGRIVEGGTALEFRVTLRRPPALPDREGHPFRVDVLLRDPALPAYSIGPYRDVNRILRYDAVEDPRTEVLLLAEGDENVYVVVGFRGPTLIMPLPGRLLVEDEDLEGLDLERLRWSVIARDENTCDFLRDGRPTLRLRASPTTPAPRSMSREDEAGGGSGFVQWLAGVGLVAAVAVGSALHRRRTRGVPPPS